MTHYRRLILMTASLLLLSNLVISQSDLKAIILNKDQIIPTDWVKKIQDQGAWEYQDRKEVKGNRVRDYHFSDYYGETWTFGASNISVSPFLYKANETEFPNYSVTYHTKNRTIVLNTSITNAGRTFQSTFVFKIINLTADYLILERIKDTFCFDFTTGRPLSKEECKAKVRNQPKRMFGGKNITIGGKAQKERVIFKLKK